MEPVTEAIASYRRRASDLLATGTFSLQQVVVSWGVIGVSSDGFQERSVTDGTDGNVQLGPAVATIGPDGWYRIR